MITLFSLQRTAIVAVGIFLSLLNFSTSNAQNVGIGVTNPAFKLHVGGDIKSDGDVRVAGYSWIFGNVSIGNVSPTGNSKLRVAGGPTYTDQLSAGGPGYLGKMFSVYGDAQVSQNLSAGSLNLTNDGIVDGNFRINGRIGVNGPTNGSYGLYVNNANSYLQGSLNVANDAIVDGNTRINGRIGINGPTNGGYGLYVNDANSYFQGSITSSGPATIASNVSIAGNTSIQGSTNLQGPVTIQGKGSVRSNGSSSLRISYHSGYFHSDVGGNQTKTLNIGISAFTDEADVRAMISEVKSTGPTNDPENIPHFTWWISKVDAATNTCTITVRNNSGLSKLLSVFFDLLVIYKD